MKKEEIKEKLLDILRSASDDESVVDLGLSSVNMLYTVIAIEETFNIRFEDVTVSSFRTFGDVVSYVEKKLS